MDTKALRQKILDLAIRGKLVSQSPNDEPASVLLERIHEQKKQMVKDGKLKPKDIKNDTIIFKDDDNLHYEKFQDGTIKCIEDQIPFDVPEGWCWSKINTIAFVTKLAGFEYTKNIAPNLCENGVPLFKGKNVHNSTVIYEFESYIPESISDELQRSQITRKCILTPYVGTIGNIGIHNRPGKYHLGSNVGKIELYNSNATILEEYVVAYLQSKYGYQQLTKHMKATAQASISIAAIRDVYLPIPPADEQYRIQNILSHALSLIDCIQTSELDIKELIMNVKSKILDIAIRGKLVPQDPNDEPASVLLERIRSKKKDLINQGKLKCNKKESVIFKGDDNSYYQNLPETWELVNFKDCATLISGRDLSKNEYNSDSIGIPYITGASNFINGNILINRWTAIPKTISVKNDILITCKGTVGELAINKYGDIHIARQIMAIRVYKNINLEYIKLFLESIVMEIKKTANGLIPGISRDDMLRLSIPLPSLTEQKRIVEAIKKIFTMINEIANQIK